MSGTTVLSLPQNRRGSSSVTAVGVVAIIGRGAYLLLSLIGLISSGDTSFSKVKWIGISLLLGLGALGVATGVGLLKRSHWARVTGIAFAIAMVSPEQISSFRTDPVGFVVDLVFSAGIGLWFLVVLSPPSTDAEFSGSQEQARPPAAIAAIAWVLLLSVVGVPLLGVLQRPFFFFGHELPGWLGTFASLFLSLLAFAAGLALLRRKMAGLWLALGLQLYGICNALIQEFNPAVRAELNTVFSQTLTKWGLSASDGSNHLSGIDSSFLHPLVVTACLVIFWNKYRESASLHAGAEITE